MSVPSHLYRDLAHLTNAHPVLAHNLGKGNTCRQFANILPWDMVNRVTQRVNSKIDQATVSRCNCTR